MNNYFHHRIEILFWSIIVVICTFFLSLSYSLLIFPSLIIYFLVNRYIKRHSTIKVTLLRNFSIVLLMSFLYAWANHSYIEEFNNVVFFDDQIGSFGDRISIILSRCSSIKELFEFVFIKQELLGKMMLHDFYIGSIAILDRLISGQYNIITILVYNSYITAITSLLVYKLFSRFFTDLKAANCALLFYFCSPMIMYTAVLLRDMHVMLLMTILIYIILSPEISWKKILVSLLVCIIIFDYRGLTGAFSFLFVFAFITWNYRKNTKILIFISTLSIIALVSILSIVISSFDSIMNTYNVYLMLRDIESTETSSFFSKLYTLPFGIKEVAVSIMYLISFPYFQTLSNIVDINSGIIVLYYVLSRVLRSYVFIFSLIALLNKRIRKNVFNNSYMNIIILISFLFIFLNTANIADRRIMISYTIIFYIFIKSRECITIDKKKLYSLFTILIMASLNVLYLLF